MTAARKAGRACAGTQDPGRRTTYRPRSRPRFHHHQSRSRSSTTLKRNRLRCAGRRISHLQCSRSQSRLRGRECNANHADCLSIQDRAEKAGLRGRAEGQLEILRVGADNCETLNRVSVGTCVVQEGILHGAGLPRCCRRKHQRIGQQTHGSGGNAGAAQCNGLRGSSCRTLDR